MLKVFTSCAKRFGRELGIILKNSFISIRLFHGDETTDKEGGGKIETKTKAFIIAGALIVAILTGIAYMAYANAETNNNNTTTEPPFGDFNQFYAGNRTLIGPPKEFGGRCGLGGARGPGAITVSDAFKENVLSIAENDSDVKQLLAQGYNVTAIRPIIQTIVEGDGSVVTKATGAMVILQKDTTGLALVRVDLTAAKVARIETITRTIIEKA